jgi:transposase
VAAATGTDIVTVSHPADFRRRAVELARLGERLIAALAKQLSISESCLRNWMPQADIDDRGSDSRSTSDEKKELAQLPRDKRRLEMENEILKRAAAYFAPGERPPKLATFRLVRAQGKLYCAAVMDAYSRRIIGWSIAAPTCAPNSFWTLGMGILRRRAAYGRDATTILHSDHETQFTSWAFGQRLRDAGVRMIHERTEPPIAAAKAKSDLPLPS